MANPLVELNHLGQSVWLDSISRQLLDSGALAAMVEAGELHGLTSNPTIFEKAIVGSNDYTTNIGELVAEGLDAAAIYRRLTTDDIRRAADLLRPVHDKTRGRDGFVSLEVSPRLAHDTEATIAEARALSAAVERPNLFVKVPATREGLPAIRRLIADGINVNVTLLFGLSRYRQVADAYAEGLEERLERGKTVRPISSVASFFLSRIDVLVDEELEALAVSRPAEADRARSLQGRIAIACAKSAYQIYKDEVIAGARFRSLAAHGARPQRLLWASTSPKSPAYSDVKYVEALIGPETVNTMPLVTLEAYRDHGHPMLRLQKNMDAAWSALHELASLGINLDAVTRQLEDEGVDKFVKPYDATIAALERAREACSVPAADRTASGG